MCLSAAEVYSVKVIQRQRRSTRCGQISLLTVCGNALEAGENAAVLWDSAGCVAYNST